MHGITVTNKAGTLVIDIEGVIGVPEWWQFDNPQERVSTYDHFKEALQKIADSNAAEVEVNIRSTGGDVNDALLIHDTLIALSAQVTTCCYGYVASAATVIAQAASAGRRRMSDNSLYLIHQSAISCHGNVNTLHEKRELLEKTDERIANLYATRSGRPVEQFTSLMEENNGNGRWLSPSEALGFGLVDEIILDTPVYNISMDEVRANKLPEVPAQLIIKPKQESMTKISNAWGAIRAALGLGETHEEVEDKDLAKVNETLVENQSTINDLTADRDRHAKMVDDLKAQVDNLKQSLAEATAERDRLKAGPTRTEECEDPPHDDVVVGNTASYVKDIEAFRE